ncbi:hypothetical protein BO85DRAFT_267593 [Aspergillus piperis CBS 112811]|uniref:Secreted protein n=1 Tax=Aspergillus piperis CBS 112811 TaxID=1448313 RepID=A0A8G1R9N4_9EURO|nr:hypothetical protein BO85DRAFT_267593 [Aspergillus piperis CBS 112811]RAH59305.1 hypothetical protein BO85DRAFT_267593 [Aspergillus piperis CBS 112811]
MLPLLKYTAALLSTLPYTLAQTYTNCNPLEKTCSSDTGSTQSTLQLRRELVILYVSRSRRWMFSTLLTWQTSHARVGRPRRLCTGATRSIPA